MSRILGVAPESVDPAIKAVFDSQTKKWGAPLLNHLLYARRPSIFRAVRGMWAGISASGLIDGALTSIINRRVAALNNCVF